MTAAPHSASAELAVIGAALLDPAVPEWLELEPEEFHTPRARACWAAVRTLAAAGSPIDTLTLEAQLERDGHLRAVGLEYLAQAAVAVPTAANVETYAAEVRRHSLTRSAMLVCSQALQEARDGLEEGETLVSLLLERLAALTANQRDSARPLGEVVRDALREVGEALERRARGEDVVAGIPTGLDEFDSVYGGLPLRVMTILAGRPGMGKSAWARGAALAANASGIGVHVFTCEDSAPVYAMRSTSSESGVPLTALVSARMTREQFSRVQSAASRLWDTRRFLVDDRGGLTAEEVVRSVRRHLTRNQTRLVVVDYVQLLRRPRGVTSAHDAITASTTTFQAAAKDGPSYLVLSQLNRQLEQRADKRPMLADLRESGSLEEHAKCVLFVYRGAVYGETDDTGRPVPDDEAELIVGKMNNGRTGTVPCRWHGETTSFR